MKRTSKLFACTALLNTAMVTTTIDLPKLWEMLFISSRKLFLFLRYINFCNFPVYFPIFLDSNGQMKVEYSMKSWTGLHKLVDVIFWITQKQLYLIPNLVRYYIANKGFFLKLFCNLNSDWSLVTGPFCFS